MTLYIRALNTERDIPKSLTPPLLLPIFFLVFIFNRIGVSPPLALCFFVPFFDRIFPFFYVFYLQIFGGPYFLISLVSKV